VYICVHICPIVLERARGVCVWGGGYGGGERHLEEAIPLREMALLEPAYVERHRETQRDTERHRETQRDTERHRETQRDTEVYRETRYVQYTHTHKRTRVPTHTNVCARARRARESE